MPRGETDDGVPLHLTLGLGALAEAVVVPERAVIPIPAGLPPEQAALLGCAVLTGVGAVRNTARVAPGESVAVVGLGGVGLAVLSAARRAGATTILAIDVAEAKRDLALAAGATDFLLSDDRLSKEVRARTESRGVDHAFECVGRAATIRAAWRLTRRGGAVTVVGMGAKDDMVSLGALDIFHSARTLRSSVYGSSDPDREVPVLAAELADGALDLRRAGQRHGPAGRGARGVRPARPGRGRSLGGHARLTWLARCPGLTQEGSSPGTRATRVVRLVRRAGRPRPSAPVRRRPCRS